MRPPSQILEKDLKSFVRVMFQMRENKISSEAAYFRSTILLVKYYIKEKLVNSLSGTSHQ